MHLKIQMEKIEVMDHHDGTMTLYAHGSPDSRLVEVGEEVVQRPSNYENRNYWKFYRSTSTF